MKDVCIKWALSLLVIACYQVSFAQGVSFFDTEPTTFIQEFTQILNQSKSERGRDAAVAIQTAWGNPEMTDEEKAIFITQVNIMVSKRYRTSPDLANYAKVYAMLKAGTTHVKIRPSEFLETTQECVFNLEPERVGKYLSVLHDFLPEGYPIKRDNFYWYASGNTPRLTFLTLEDAKGTYQAPVVRYEETDLKYLSSRYDDSTHVKGTSGDFHPLSMTFFGNGGRVDWSKVGLDSNDIYCDFKDYKLNLNYGLLQVDTVTFHYKSLLPGPLLGRFEDRNAGHKNVNKANYPYFKSHEGGVVIEDFLPSVRYEGGFSLRGLRKIGSSYDIWVDYTPDESSFADSDIADWYGGSSTSSLADDEELNATNTANEWDYGADQGASFSSEDDSDDLFWLDEEEGDEDGYEEDLPVDESSLFPSQVQKHIPAKLTIKRDAGSTSMVLVGEAFVLDQEKMISKDNQVKIFTADMDSIYHPSMDVLFLAEDSTVTIKKPKRSNQASIPFTSSYHEYFLYFETIIWDLGKDELKFTAFVDRENKVSAIESFDYFTKARFDQFKGILKFNPIGA
ncbi:MAG: hypothetical protein AAF399_03735, partial [Bacteroidota bacterium]